MDPKLTPPAFACLSRPPFVGWLVDHKLICTGFSWTLEDGPNGPTFLRSLDDRRVDLIVRPKLEKL
jgi:hypothetical protein